MAFAFKKKLEQKQKWISFLYTHTHKYKKIYGKIFKLIIAIHIFHSVKRARIKENFRQQHKIQFMEEKNQNILFD